jgi:hypothetical protein
MLCEQENKVLHVAEDYTINACKRIAFIIQTNVN